MNAVILKPDREAHVRNKHPWIFLGAVATFPKFTDGDILSIQTASGHFVGYGYFNAGQSIVGRMISFTDTDPLETIAQSISNAINLRQTIIPHNTTAYRLINGEGDNLPGLIVDRYGDVLVLQINTLGMERLKPLIIENLQKLIAPKAIYEKANSQTRRREGLPDVSQWLVGKADEPITVTEHGLQFSVQLTDSQKTGFFLDQREMRQLVKEYAKDKTVLNCFGYTGGFSVYALAGGAITADTVDTDTDALTMASTNASANNFSGTQHSAIAKDVFSFLEQPTLPRDYDFIILDPPAFAKRNSDVKNASRGYRELNRLALQHLPKHGLLLTSSCSQHIDNQLFQTIVFQAAKDAGRDVRILSHHRLAADHPVNLYFPEGDYLKSLLLYVS